MELSELERAVEARWTHDRKCRKRNVNTCRKCESLTTGLREAYDRTPTDESFMSILRRSAKATL